MKNYRCLTLCLIWMSVVLVGCNAQPEVSPSATATQTVLPTNTNTPIPTATATLMPTETFTPVPTSTDTPVPTFTPSPTPDCDPDDVLRNIKANFPYEEFEISYLTMDDLSTLTLWYVDSEINPIAGSDDVDQNAELAMRGAALASQRLAQIDSCIPFLFEAINPIVVDSNYNGWFSAQVEPNLLPEGENPSEDELDAVEAVFTIGYVRTIAPEQPRPAPSGACTWQDTRARIQNHFFIERQNVTFYFVIDETGRNVWAQWDGPADFLAFASMMNVAMELGCLHPSPTQLLMIVVDEQGEVGMMALWPESGFEALDLNQVRILYQK